MLLTKLRLTWRHLQYISKSADETGLSVIQVEHVMDIDKSAHAKSAVLEREDSVISGLTTEGDEIPHSIKVRTLQDYLNDPLENGVYLKFCMVSMLSSSLHQSQSSAMMVQAVRKQSKDISLDDLPSNAAEDALTSWPLDPHRNNDAKTRTLDSQKHSPDEIQVRSFIKFY